MHTPEHFQVHSQTQIRIYLHVCVTATGSCLQSRDPVCETEMRFLKVVTSFLFT